MVLTLILIMRKVFSLESYINIKHIEYMNIVIDHHRIASRHCLPHRIIFVMVCRREYEQYAFINRATGPYWWAYA